MPTRHEPNRASDGAANAEAVYQRLAHGNPDAITTAELRGHLKNADSTIVALSASILGARKAVEAVPDLVVALNGMTDANRMHVLGALERLGKDADPAVASILKIVKDEGESSALVPYATAALKGIGTREAARALLDLSTSSSGETKHCALHHLGEIGPQGEFAAQTIYQKYLEHGRDGPSAGDYRYALGGLGFSESHGEFLPENLQARRSLEKLEHRIGQQVTILVGENGKHGLHTGLLVDASRTSYSCSARIRHRSGDNPFLLVLQDDITVE